jgi:hypothetical protein
VLLGSLCSFIMTVPVTDSPSYFVLSLHVLQATQRLPSCFDTCVMLWHFSDVLLPNHLCPALVRQLALTAVFAWVPRVVVLDLMEFVASYVRLSSIAPCAGCSTCYNGGRCRDGMAGDGACIKPDFPV